MPHRAVPSSIQGVFPPVVTPFNQRGDIDEVAFRANLERYRGTGLAGVLVAGSTGEAPYLSERERLRLVDLARAMVSPPELLVVGTGLESTRETIRLSREAVARGADVLLVLTPNYYKNRMDAAALKAHYRSVADAVSRPVLVYSIPQYTGITIEGATVANLSRHPNIVGLKESSGDLGFARQIVRQSARGFRLLMGSARIFLDGLRAGAVGGVLGQACFAPELCVAIYKAFIQGRRRAAREAQQKLACLAAIAGVAATKAAMDLCGYRGGSPRAPLVPLNSAELQAVRVALEQARRALAV
jgi:4-hydroxy-2-oxoglutarate aldolase